MKAQAHQVRKNTDRSILAYIHEDFEKFCFIIEHMRVDPHGHYYNFLQMILTRLYADKDGKIKIKGIKNVECTMDQAGRKALLEHGIYWKYYKEKNNDLSGLAGGDGEDRTEGEGCQAEKEWNNA